MGRRNVRRITGGVGVLGIRIWVIIVCYKFNMNYDNKATIGSKEGLKKLLD